MTRFSDGSGSEVRRLRGTTGGPITYRARQSKPKPSHPDSGGFPRICGGGRRHLHAYYMSPPFDDPTMLGKKIVVVAFQGDSVLDNEPLEGTVIGESESKTWPGSVALAVRLEAESREMLRPHTGDPTEIFVDLDGTPPDRLPGMPGYRGGAFVKLYGRAAKGTLPSPSISAEARRLRERTKPFGPRGRAASPRQSHPADRGSVSSIRAVGEGEGLSPRPRLGSQTAISDAIRGALAAANRVRLLQRASG